MLYGDAAVLAGLVSIFVVGSLGYIKGAVDRSGLAAGILIGSLFALSGGLIAVITLITFFLIGSFFTKYGYSRKESLGAAEPKKGARGWKSVLSNLFFPSLAIILYRLSSDNAYALAFVSSISCSLADTLGSEIGLLDRRGPWIITSMRRTQPGTSGAISILGTISSILGSFIIPIEAFQFGILSFNELFISSMIAFSSSMLDSLLGATIQAKYLCDGRVVEDPSYCSEAELLSGFRFVDNHAVNLISTGFAFLLSLIEGML
jgi:uncharacterized protein (TIGR00297 family)